MFSKVYVVIGMGLVIGAVLWYISPRSRHKLRRWALIAIAVAIVVAIAYNYSEGDVEVAPPHQETVADLRSNQFQLNPWPGQRMRRMFAIPQPAVTAPWLWHEIGRRENAFDHGARLQEVVEALCRFGYVWRVVEGRCRLQNV